MERLGGKTAVVTGASRGIGRAIAARLAQEGADVGISYLANANQAEAVANEIQAMGRRTALLPVDLRDDGSVRAMATAAQDALGPVDIWVNNAGVEYEEPLVDIQEAHWDDTFAVNVKGLFFCCRAAGEAMLSRAQHATTSSPVGSIINIASRFGLLGDPTSLPYGASKAAVINMTKALAKHYAPHVRVNAVAPAYTPTDMTAHVSEDYLARLNASTPLARVTQPEDTAAAVAFLASEDAGFITGVTLPVDGGYTLK